MSLYPSTTYDIVSTKFDCKYTSRNTLRDEPPSGPLHDPSVSMLVLLCLAMLLTDMTPCSLGCVWLCLATPLQVLKADDNTFVDTTRLRTYLAS